MAIIELETKIKSSIEICFDLARSIDLHQISTAHTKEKAIGGITEGLIGLDEFVTWQAVHLGIKQKLTTKITGFRKPFYFRDEQWKGPFKYILHDHHFETLGDMVIMKDIFKFQSPGSFVGKFLDKVFLTGYLKKLLQQRNRIIKAYAETLQWKSVLDEREYL